MKHATLTVSILVMSCLIGCKKNVPPNPMPTTSPATRTHPEASAATQTYVPAADELRAIQQIEATPGPIHLKSISDDGATLMHVAARDGMLSLLNALLEKQADVDIATKSGLTPLAYACMHRQEACARLLMDHGAAVKSVDKNSFTPLHWAAASGHPVLIKLLVSKGADVNARQADGATAIHLAAYYGHTGAVEVLLESGADVHLTTKDGDTPLDVARKAGKTDIVQMLITGGKPVSVPPAFK